MWKRKREHEEQWEGTREQRVRLLYFKPTIVVSIRGACTKCLFWLRTSWIDLLGSVGNSVFSFIYGSNLNWCRNILWQINSVWSPELVFCYSTNLKKLDFLRANLATAGAWMLAMHASVQPGMYFLVTRWSISGRSSVSVSHFAWCNCFDKEIRRQLLHHFYRLNFALLTLNEIGRFTSFFRS